MFTSDAKAYQQAWDSFRSRLAASRVSVRSSKVILGRSEPRNLSTEINKRNLDLTLAFGTRASRLAVESAVRTPVIFCMVLNPTGLFRSNSAGVMMEVSPDVKLRMIKRILPRVRTIGTVYSSETFSCYVKVLAECDQMGISLVAKKIETKKQLRTAARDVGRKSDCFLMLPDTKLYTPASVRALLLESLRLRFPVVGLSSDYTRAGALFSLDGDYNEVGKQAAEIALRILKGENPRNIAPMQPRKCRLSVNVAVARRMGIHIPASVLREAIEVYGV